MKVTIHASPSIEWHKRRGAFFAEGFRKIGVEVEITSDRFRHDGLPILLGTSMWKPIERDGGEFLLVDRCSFGDTEKFVQLVRSGHGRRGDHRCANPLDASRWEAVGMDLVPWRTGGSSVVLCGQIETFSPHFATPDDWYRLSAPHATHFRPHPAGLNPTKLPSLLNFDGVHSVLTLNSSIGVQCVLNGIVTECDDEGAMAFPVSGSECDRLPWCHWLAWTQWSDDEIREGIPWAYLL